MDFDAFFKVIGLEYYLPVDYTLITIAFLTELLGVDYAWLTFMVVSIHAFDNLLSIQLYLHYITACYQSQVKDHATTILSGNIARC